MKGTSQYPNIKAVIHVAIGFCTLFVGFGTGANVASKALRENGFANLGFYSLAFIYIVFALSSCMMGKVLSKIQPKHSIALGSSTYAIWIFSLALTVLSFKHPSMQGVFSSTVIHVIVIVCSILCGMGAACLWVA